MSLNAVQLQHKMEGSSRYTSAILAQTPATISSNRQLSLTRLPAALDLPTLHTRFSAHRFTMRNAPPPNKKRKIKTVHEEKIDFDPAAREEYLTGFHKRKVERRKHAEQENAKKEKEEKLRFRKEVRSANYPALLEAQRRQNATAHTERSAGWLPGQAQDLRIQRGC